jgi:hypothetical protein
MESNIDKVLARGEKLQSLEQNAGLYYFLYSCYAYI